MNIRTEIDNNQLITDETGQTMAEYGVTLGVIVLGVIVAITALALAAANKLDGVATKIGGIV